MASWFSKFEELLEPQELPGDPGTVRTAGHKYANMAQQVLNAAGSIRRMANDNGNHVSQAVDKLVDVAGDVGDKVERLHSRYDAAGSALTAYAGHLETAQHEAKAAVKDYYDAKGQRDAANAKKDAADDEAKAAGDDDTTKQQAQDKSNRLQNAADGHEQDMKDARERYLNAVRNLNTAAQSAHDQIASAINDDGLKDSRWDKLKNAVGKVVHAIGNFIKEHAAFFKMLHKILSLITTVLSIASIFFPVLAPFALGFAAATLLVGIGLYATGNMSLLDLGLDALTVVTLGIGGAATGVMKGAATTAREATAAEEAVAGSSKTFVETAQVLSKTGKSILGKMATDIGEKSLKGFGKDALEFGLAKIPKFAGAGKVAAFGKSALSEGNVFGDVFKVMGARGLNNFKYMTELGNLGKIPTSVKVMDNLAHYEGLANGLIHKGHSAALQYQAHQGAINHIGDDVGKYAKDLGKFAVNHPGIAAMAVGI